ncbi:hypothetical protein HF325_000707 [Metschnikowia pulcherrima]|uniref:Peptidyl-prolyl cis-trans isomerase n=1 Tax=Metschnikowia pulcherrima TaxID=27326 RepID=A0A8H7LF24_9ASCO|nr:hypothetical protein HF325_000707 [Metschnikowia pulcherrima]
MSIVYFDLSSNGEQKGRVVFKLYNDVVPKTAENFRALCTGEKGRSKTSGKLLSYRGCSFHRVIENFMCQGGDFTDGTGTGGESIYGAKFEDENFNLTHDKPFLLSMANAGPNTNGLQFFITTVPTPHLNGKHVVFGEVIQGKSVVRQLERCEKGANDKPKEIWIISECGELPLDYKPETARVDDGTGDIYEAVLADDDKIDQAHPESGKKAVSFAVDALAFPEIDAKTTAKAHYRSGSGYLLLKDEDNAQKAFNEAHRLSPEDAAIIKGLKDVKLLAQQRAAKQKKAMSKFFN